VAIQILTIKLGYSEGLFKKGERPIPSAALAMMERALQINPSNIDAVSQIANIYIIQNNPLAKSYYKRYWLWTNLTTMPIIIWD